MNDIDTTLMMVTYNRLELTKQTLGSLYFNLEERPFNLVIVDNGSTDGTVKFLKEFIEKNNSKIFATFLPENKGIAVGRNIALRKANELNTKWYCTIDNDVLMPKGWLQECINILETNKNFGAIGVNMEDVKYPLITTNGFTFQNKPQGNLGTACMVFSRQLHQMIGYFTTEYGKYGEEDADFGMRARVAGFNLGYIECMGTHIGSDEKDNNPYREFKTKQHNDNLALFRQNCAMYAQRRKSLFVPYKD
jgi:GT2 family glycosyltransferase